MNVLDLAATPLAQTIVQALVHFLWQGALIGLAAFAVMRLGGWSAPARYAIGVAALAVMLAAPVVTVAAVAARADTTALARDTTPGAMTASLQVDAPRDVAMAAPAGPVTADLGVAATAAPVLQMAVLALWMAGVAVLSCRLLGGWFVAGRLGRSYIRPVRTDVEALARRVAGRLALDRVVRLFESTRVAVPVTVGWIRPVVLVPAAALSGLSPAQVEALLAHELAHVRRHDYLVNLLQSAVETILFYHPAVWWVSRQVRIDREHCCDDLAVGVCDRVVYATALTDLAALTTPRLALAATDGSLLARVRRILGQPARATELGGAWTPAFALALMAGLMAPVVGASDSRADALETTAPVARAQTTSTPAPVASDAPAAQTAQAIEPALPTLRIEAVAPSAAYALGRMNAPRLIVRRDLAPWLVGANQINGARFVVPPGDSPWLQLYLQEPPVNSRRAAEERARRDAQTADEARAREAALRATLREVRQAIDEAKQVTEREREVEAQVQRAATEARMKDLAAEYEAMRRTYEDAVARQQAGTAAADVLKELRARLEQLERQMTAERTALETQRVIRDLRLREVVVDAEDLRRRFERAQTDEARLEARQVIPASERARVNDVLVIEITGEPDLPRAYTIRTDGTIRLPFLGSIKAEGQTAGQIRDAIGRQLADRKLGSASQVHVTVRR